MQMWPCFFYAGHGIQFAGAQITWCQSMANCRTRPTLDQLACQAMLQPYRAAGRRYTGRPSTHRNWAPATKRPVAVHIS